MITSIQTNKPAAPSGTKRRLKIWLFVIALFMGWAIYTFITQLESQGQAEIKLAEVQGKIDVATKQMNDLRLQVERLNDKEYIEQLATKEQGLVKKGEKQIVVE
ncbi:septum formation initiator family protein [Paenibacillus oenotherae]|uniref:Septum formation initiator family protein n=1 Tax=Paenibacillus oenotherae TaxID=1435645 RepID=A0ABS7DE13_9BACL|nr:septum formation initiator family protein [Paenibacillus oenotherae]MBW7477413.1 septum formation initiator family protein [Paenibacillus oenotherae]